MAQVDADIEAREERAAKRRTADVVMQMVDDEHPSATVPQAVVDFSDAAAAPDAAKAAVFEQEIPLERRTSDDDDDVDMN